MRWMARVFVICLFGLGCADVAAARGYAKPESADVEKTDDDATEPVEKANAKAARHKRR